MVLTGTRGRDLIQLKANSLGPYCHTGLIETRSTLLGQAHKEPGATGRGVVHGNGVVQPGGTSWACPPPNVTRSVLAIS